MALESKLSSVQFRAAREGYSRVLLRGSFIGITLSRSRTIVSAAAMKSLRRSAWRQIFQPCTLALLGLAVAVALWGFGYKLSLYHAHRSAPLRSAATRLWMDPPSDALIVVQRLKSRSHSTTRRSALPGLPQRLPQSASVLANIARTAPPGFLSPDSAASPRSPPSLHLRSA